MISITALNRCLCLVSSHGLTSEVIDSHQALRSWLNEKVWDGFDLVPLPNVGHCMFVSVQAEFSPACSGDSSILRICAVYITQYHLSLQFSFVLFFKKSTVEQSTMMNYSKTEDVKCQVDIAPKYVT